MMKLTLIRQKRLKVSAIMHLSYANLNALYNSELKPTQSWLARVSFPRLPPVACSCSEC